MNPMKSDSTGFDLVDSLQRATTSIPLPVSTIAHAGRYPKSFGTTNISGNSSVIQGDIFVSSGVIKIECSHLRPHQPMLIPQASEYSGHTLSSITRTTSGFGGRWQLMPYVTLTQKTITRANGERKESSWLVTVSILQLCMLSIGLAYSLSGLTLFRPRLQNIVSDDAPFVVACRRGDVITMKRLVSQGQAAYSDITKDNLSPLYFALESGIPAAIEEVLNNCMDIDVTFGSNQTSALSWALYHRNRHAVRLILAKDADLQYISLLGWTPAFYLWRHRLELQESALELLQALQSSDPKGFLQSISGTIDVGELSLLHRVATLGTPDELQWLLKCGVDAHLRAGQLEWTAMFHAAYDGRLDNLRVLGEAYPESLIHDTDLRGWTLLHIAAAEGQTDIIQWLVELGADPNAKSQPSFVDVDETLYGLACTPAEVARAEGVEREQAYWTAVAQVYGDDLFPLLIKKCS